MIKATVETIEQFEACLKSAVVSLVYIDSAFFAAEEYAAFIQRAHDAGKQIGLRLPYIWRREAEQYFDQADRKGLLKDAGFDIYLFRNIEGALYFEEHGLLDGVSFVSDHSIYVFNQEAEAMALEMLPDGLQCVTVPLELNEKELTALCRDLNGVETELVVYGRAPMMVSDQCVYKTVKGCSHKEGRIILRDRTNADMPVKNCCRFCYNIIYNAVPTVLFDQTKMLKNAAPTHLRYEFTTEDAKTTSAILNMGREQKYSGDFTRGHLKRGV